MRMIECLNSDGTKFIEQHLPDGTKMLCNVWRYMSTCHFENMIKEKRIYVSRIEDFDDDLEGQGAVHIWSHWYKSDFAGKKLEDFEKRVKSRFFALCFHNRQLESELMWRAYCPDGGIALRSTPGRLLNTNWATDNMIHSYYLLKVTYVDYQNMNKGKFHPIAMKQLEYEGEAEIRMIFSAIHERVKDNIELEYSKKLPKNIYLNYDPKSFLNVFDQIVFSPRLHKKTKDKLQNLVCKNLGDEAALSMVDSKIVR